MSLLAGLVFLTGFYLMVVYGSQHKRKRARARAVAVKRAREKAIHLEYLKSKGYGPVNNSNKE